MILEILATAGAPLNALVEAAYKYYPLNFDGKTRDIEDSLRISGPIYLADCMRAKAAGYGGKFSW